VPSQQQAPSTPLELELDSRSVRTIIASIGVGVSASPSEQEAQQLLPSIRDRQQQKRVRKATRRAMRSRVTRTPKKTVSARTGGGRSARLRYAPTAPRSDTFRRPVLRARKVNTGGLATSGTRRTPMQPKTQVMMLPPSKRKKSGSQTYRPAARIKRGSTARQYALQQRHPKTAVQQSFAQPHQPRPPLHVPGYSYEAPLQPHASGDSSSGLSNVLRRHMPSKRRKQFQIHDQKRWYVHVASKKHTSLPPPYIRSLAPQ
jgi:hypothetical protein